MAYLLRYLLVLLIVILSLFDKHIEKILGVDLFPGADLVVLSFAGLLTVIFPVIKRIHKIDLYIIGFMIFVVLVGIVKGPFLPALLGTIFISKVLLAFLASRFLIISPQKVRSIFKIIFYVSVISGALTIIQIFYRFDPLNFNQLTYGSHHFIGLMANTNKNGHLLMIGYLFGLYLFRHYRFRPYLLSLFFLIPILLTDSRQSLLVFLCVGFLIYELIIKRNIFKTSLVLSGALLTILFFQDYFISSYIRFYRSFQAGEQFRIYALKVFANVFQDFPWLGVGAGRFGGAVAKIFDSPVHWQYNLFDYYQGIRDDIPVRTIDMFWPHLVGEIGLIGTLFYLFIISAITFILYKYYKTYSLNICLYVMLAIISILMLSFVSMALENTHIAMVVFLLAGIILKNDKFKSVK